MSIITKSFKVNGVLTDATSMTLSSADSTFGVKRNDTDAVVVADGTAMTRISTGIYQHEFTDPANNLEYTSAIEVVYQGITTHFQSTFDGPIDADAGVTVTYLDSNGDTKTLVEDTDYTVDDTGLTARIFPVAGSSWPAVRGQPSAVTITYGAGWANAASVPDQIKAIIKLIVGGLYENREHMAGVPSTFKVNPAVDAMIGHYKIMTGR